MTSSEHSNLLGELVISPEVIYESKLADTGLGSAISLTPEQLRDWPSGDLFGLTMDAGMGWPADRVHDPGVLILTTGGGLRDAEGQLLALGYHTGHVELGMLAQIFAKQAATLRLKPYCAHGSDPCDGRSNGTSGMRDSLGWRNSAYDMFSRLVRSMPHRKALVFVAGCDKAVPCARMVIGASAAHFERLPAIIIPGGASLESSRGAENNGVVQSLSTRYAHGEIEHDYAEEQCGTSCASPGGSCTFMGSGNTGQGEAEAAGLTVPHAAWVPSGSPAWADVGVRSAHAVRKMVEDGFTADEIITDEMMRNLLTFHAALAGSTNSTLHLPAFARSAGLSVPTIDDWRAASQRVPRIVNTQPISEHATVRAYFAGGVPEIVYQLAEAGVWNTDCKIVGGHTWEQVIEWWKTSERRERFQSELYEKTGVAADDIILPVSKARSTPGFGPTMSFLTGNLTPDGSIVKSAAIQPDLIPDGVLDMTLRARVFPSEWDAMQAIKSQGDNRIRPGEIIVLIGLGLLGQGMPEIYQVTAALKNTEALRGIPVITDARFSGVSTGACVGHIGPEARAGGPVAKVIDGDWVRLYIDGNQSSGAIDLVGAPDTLEGDQSSEMGAKILSRRGEFNIEQGPNEKLPPQVRNMALLATISGGIWKGAFEDPTALREAVNAFYEAK